MQGSAKSKAEAEKAFGDAMKLDDEVKDMMKELADAENVLEKKKEEAAQDMMMASMVNIKFVIGPVWFRVHQDRISHRCSFRKNIKSTVWTLCLPQLETFTVG